MMLSILAAIVLIPFVTAQECPASFGTFASPTQPSAFDLGKREAFVVRNGPNLTLLGQAFRMVGGNIYWLGLDENVIPDPAYPSKTRVLEVLGDISAMQGTVVRGHTLGISFGNPLSIVPSEGVFNDAAYESIDFAIFAARLFGLKLLIPLVDNYNYYHGGKYTFIGFQGIPFSGIGADITPPDVGAFFFNTTAIVNDFKNYIVHHLSHVNQFTGIALGEDPTILGWESGNELSAIRFGDGPAPPAWTAEIATLVKSLAPNHLFMDGTYGLADPSILVNEQVDIFSDHFYPANISRLQSGASLVLGSNRVFWAGEYDWTGLNGGDPVPEFLAAIENINGMGDAFWSLFAHDDECCQFVNHSDGFSIYYPGRTADMAISFQTISEHASSMNANLDPQIVAPAACLTTLNGTSAKRSIPEFPDWVFPRGTSMKMLRELLERDESPS